jgi:UDP-N-acetyl-D-glucosamine/UDP-N-acetyl-D-galactosamine dehydrogenase
MGTYVASQLMKAMNKKTIKIKNAKILIMGLTFKENCNDIRNSGILSVINKLKQHHCNLDLYDPWVNRNEVKNLYNINPITSLNPNTYDGIIISVAHDKFKNMGIKSITALGKKTFVLYDLKYVFSKQETDLRL